MRIIFAGTPDFSVPPLVKLLNAGHEIVAVYTQPDRESGRGRKIRPAPVKQVALENHLAVQQPSTLRNEIAIEKLKSYQADVMVVVAYGLILPAEILDIPRYGCLNIHASLLPRWRGAAPIQRAIAAGDKHTGITIMQMDSGLDTGDILAQFPVEITAEDTGQTLHDKLSETGAEAIVEVLNNLPSYQQTARSQNNELASYASKIGKEEGNIDWAQSAEQILRKIRAFNPWPGSYTWYGNTKLGIWAAEVKQLQHNAMPGQILCADKSGIVIACGNNCLQILQLQRPGGRPVYYRDFINGMHLENGAILTSNHND